MITHLRLSNFRRHEDTELRFDTDQHLILVSGANGVGKSTIFEAVLFALYGEGRNGRANLDRLCRRGAEIEGTEVEVAFSIGNTTYRVKRRRDNGTTSAVLWANDVALTEGTREVTAEITHILGMDAKGFRVATYAQQRELDGLASMRSYERGKMLSRLLRLDIITRAKDQAGADFRELRAVIDRLPEIDDLDDLKNNVASTEKLLAGQQAAVAETRSALAALDERIAQNATIEADYRAAVTAEARAEMAAKSAKDHVARLKNELAGIEIPEPLTSGDVPAETLSRRAIKLEEKIAAAELATKQRTERKKVKAALDAVERRLTELAGMTSDVENDRLQTELDDLRFRIDQLGARLQQAHTDAEVCRGDLKRLREQRTRAGTLGDVCPTCGQPVTKEFKASHLAEIDDAIAAATAALDEAESTATDLKRQIDGFKAEAAEVTERIDTLRSVEHECNELVANKDFYLRQLNALPDQEVDLQSLYAQRAKLAIEVDLATQATERDAIRRTLLERKAAIEQNLRLAVTEERKAVEAHRAAMVDEAMHARYAEYRELIEARQTEAEVLANLERDTAVTSETLRSLKAQLRRAEEAAAQRDKLITEAEVAGTAKEVLGRVETRWAQQIRPALEGTIAEILARLSDGRFDAVRLDTNYNLTVRDDGAFRPLTELSGGEIDLVALGMRLGLAAVVAEHHGAGGPGFLILDECFGSQDPQRRTAIMNALRSLRSQYGQIFLISHVGGLEDAADSVIEIGWDKETNTTTITSDL